MAILLTVLIVLPIQTSAASDTLWDDARNPTSANPSGSIGGISINLTNNTIQESITSNISELPRIVEVYTATWCMNCVKTEHALDDAIGVSDVTRIHYHRHWFETLDPFGSNSTDSMWVELYGAGSVLSSETSYSSGMERVAPSKVFDGERIYTGGSANSNSLVTDYSTALSLGSNHPFTQNGTLVLEVERDEANLFYINWSHSLWNPNGETTTIIPRILFVEHSAHYPDGSNGMEYYNHVLHEATMLQSSQSDSLLNNSIHRITPTPWDDDDMSVVLILDWYTEIMESSALPAPAVSTLLCMLAALVPRRHRDSES